MAGIFAGLAILLCWDSLNELNVKGGLISFTSCWTPDAVAIEAARIEVCEKEVLQSPGNLTTIAATAPRIGHNREAG